MCPLFVNAARNQDREHFNNARPVNQFPIWHPSMTRARRCAHERPKVLSSPISDYWDAARPNSALFEHHSPRVIATETIFKAANRTHFWKKTKPKVSSRIKYTSSKISARSNKRKICRIGRWSTSMCTRSFKKSFLSSVKSEAGLHQKQNSLSSIMSDLVFNLGTRDVGVRCVDPRRFCLRANTLLGIIVRKKSIDVPAATAVATAAAASTYGPGWLSSSARRDQVCILGGRGWPGFAPGNLHWTTCASARAGQRAFSAPARTHTYACTLARVNARPNRWRKIMHEDFARLHRRQNRVFTYRQ